MTEKTTIVAHLGESAVLLPQLLSRALDANDRAKSRMTVLQDALAHAEQPAAPVRKLREGHAAGLDDIALDATVSGARLIDGKHLASPGGKALIEVPPFSWTPKHLCFRSLRCRRNASPTRLSSGGR